MRTPACCIRTRCFKNSRSEKNSRDGSRRLEAELLESATLLVKGRKALRATTASVPEHGNHLIATLRFPRFEDLSDGDGLIEFAAQAGPMDIRQKFKLRDMNYKGRLEL